jgi:hypothetical protein
MPIPNLQLQSTQPDYLDCVCDFDFLEVTLPQGELDPLLEKPTQTWQAGRPETLHLGTAHTSWEEMTTEKKGNEERNVSMPVSEHPQSLCPSFRPSLREGFENCVRSGEDILQGVFSDYFETVDEESLRINNVGCTLMIQDLRNKWSIEDVLGMLDEVGAEHVDYVFLPLSVWETKKNKPRESKKTTNKTRNKAYGFVHISDIAASKAFVERLSQYAPPNDPQSESVRPRQMCASVASTQGVVQNLLRQMDIHSSKWHPRAGAMALRLGDSLVPVNVADLRKFLLNLLKDNPKDAPPCLQKQCTFSFFFGPSSFVRSG